MELLGTGRVSPSSGRCKFNLPPQPHPCARTIDGLALFGGDLGQNIHGMFIDRTAYSDHEDAVRVERCQVTHFTGDGLHFARVWVFDLRHSILAHNRGDGLNLRGWDGHILDNWLSNNGRTGYAARYETEGAAITFTSNRVEWNDEENMMIVGGVANQITGNHLDRAGTYGLASAREPHTHPDNRRLPAISSRGVANSQPRRRPFCASSDRGVVGLDLRGQHLCERPERRRQGHLQPALRHRLRRSGNCVITNNVLHDGALRQLFLDLGGHHDGVIVRDNPGRLFVA